MKGWDDFSRSPRRGHCGERSEEAIPRGLTRKLTPLNQILTDRRS